MPWRTRSITTADELFIADRDGRRTLVVGWLVQELIHGTKAERRLYSSRRRVIAGILNDNGEIDPITEEHVVRPASTEPADQLHHPSTTRGP